MARQVGNAVERTKVLWRESVQDFVRQYGNLELNSLWHAQAALINCFITVFTRELLFVFLLVF